MVVTQFGLPASFIDGAVGVAASNTPVVVHSDMTEAEVAQAIAEGMSAEFAGYRLQLVTANGDQIFEGDSFSISDGAVTVQFEFDSGYSLLAPAAPGAIADADTFTINDGAGGADVVFEFDADASLTDPSHVPIDIGLRLSILVPAAGVAAPNGVADGETFLINDGSGSGDVLFEFDNNGVTTLGNRVVLINDILTLTVPFSGGGAGGVSDGETFFINQGLGGPDVVFEFNSNAATTPGNVIINISSLTTQDQLANLIAAAIQGGCGPDPRLHGRRADPSGRAHPAARGEHGGDDRE